MPDRRWWRRARRASARAPAGRTRPSADLSVAPRHGVAHRCRAPTAALHVHQGPQRVQRHVAAGGDRQSFVDRAHHHLERVDRLSPARAHQRGFSRAFSSSSPSGSRWQRTCRPALGAVGRVGARRVVVRGRPWWPLLRCGHTARGRTGSRPVLRRARRGPLAAPGPNTPFVAARTLGATSARAVWAAVWLDTGRPDGRRRRSVPGALHDLVANIASGQPGWLLRIDRWSERSCCTTAPPSPCSSRCSASWSPSASTRIRRSRRSSSWWRWWPSPFVWVAVQNFGGDLVGGTDGSGLGAAVAAVHPDLLAAGAGTIERVTPNDGGRVRCDEGASEEGHRHHPPGCTTSSVSDACGRRSTASRCW